MDVTYQEHPTVTIGNSVFKNVPTIIQWEDVPLMEVGRFETAGFTTRFSVFHSDGTKIAVVKGKQIYLTEEGRSAALKLRHEPNVTACDLEGRTIFELRRQGAAAVKGAAELYTPEGIFIKASDSGVAVTTQVEAGTLVAPNGTAFYSCSIDSTPIGIHVTKNVLAIGVDGGPYPENFTGMIIGTGKKAMRIGENFCERFKEELDKKIEERFSPFPEDVSEFNYTIRLHYQSATGKFEVEDIIPKD